MKRDPVTAHARPGYPDRRFRLWAYGLLALGCVATEGAGCLGGVARADETVEAGDPNPGPAIPAQPDLVQSAAAGESEAEAEAEADAERTRAVRWEELVRAVGGEMPTIEVSSPEPDPPEEGHHIVFSSRLPGVIMAPSHHPDPEPLQGAPPPSEGPPFVGDPEGWRMPSTLLVPLEPPEPSAPPDGDEPEAEDSR